MKRSTSGATLRILGPLVVLLAGTLPALLRGDEARPLPSIDPHKVVTADRCGRCHESEVGVWKKSAHALAFNTLHTKQSAQEIAKRMGVKDIRHDSMCLDCHYTPKADETGEVDAVSGVSCESCHGAAKDWVGIHYNYGGGGLNFKTESPEHRQQRIESSKAAGMFRPSTVYDVVQNCYRCHTVPNEALVDQGNHASGSDIVLVEWFDKIRHNFLASLREGDGTQERAMTPAEKRVMWVVGWALDLEYSYRGMANATEQGVFLKAMERRAREARARLSDVRAVIAVPQVDTMLAIAAGVEVAPNHAAEQRRNAERIGAQNRAFIAAHDGADLQAVDTLIAGWRPPSATEPVAHAAADAGAGAGAVKDDGKQAVGAKVAHVDMTIPAHKAIGLSACSKCHGKQAAWWSSDRHANAANALQSSGRALQIAHYYGLAPAEMRAPDGLCMDCHAGRGAASIDDGVSCEACHGPGKDYKEPHQDGAMALGLERPGFKAALSLGMVDMKNASPMAANCVRCHYITQDRLISSGHPTGATFDLSAAHAKIKHWDHALASDPELKKAYAVMVQKRGPIPTVPVALGGDSSSSSSGNGDAPSPGGPGAPDITLTPFPTIPPNASVGEILIILRNRLRELHKAAQQP